LKAGGGTNGRRIGGGGGSTIEREVPLRGQILCLRRIRSEKSEAGKRDQKEKDKRGKGIRVSRSIVKKYMATTAKRRFPMS